MIKHLYDEIAKRWLDGCDSIWIYSDPHFGDLDSYMFRFPQYFKGVVASELPLCIRCMDEMQIKHINSKAGKNSCLIILGDVGDLECVKKLKAKRKILLLGNHDKGASNYKREYETYHLEKVILKNYTCYGPGQFEDSYEYKKVIDSFDNHLFDEVYEGPLMINDRVILSHEPIMGYANYLYNIHGHVHNKNYTGDSHHLNCCAEAIDYTPINLLSLFNKGLLKDIDSIHRMTIDDATKRKHKRK